MSILSEADLTSMRAVLNESLPDTAVIQRFTSTPDGQGGQVETWTAAGTVACRIGPLPGAEVTVADRLSTRAVQRATFAAHADIEARDRVTVAALVPGPNLYPGPGNHPGLGTTYEVVDLDSPRSYEVSTRVTLVEVDG